MPPAVPAAAAAAGPAAEVPGMAADRSLLREAAACAAERHSFPLCLWAVELRLERHPVSGEPVRFELPGGEPPLYADVCSTLRGSL